MKKMKKALSLITAISALVSFTAIPSANAWYHGDYGDEIAKKLENGYTLINVDDYDFLSDMAKDEGLKICKYGIIKDDDIAGSYMMHLLELEPNEIEVVLPADTDLVLLHDIVHEICPNAISYREIVLSESNEMIYKIFSPNSDASHEEQYDFNITKQQARQIYQALDEKCGVREFKYKSNFFSGIQPWITYFTGYPKSNFQYGPLESFFGKYAEYTDEERIELLENYIKENDLNCHIGDYSEIFTFEEYLNSTTGIDVEEAKEIYDDMMESARASDVGLCVIPNEKITAVEHLEIANMLYTDLGFCPMALYQLSPSNGLEGTVIEMHDTILGDANEDKELGIADVVTIMQAIADPDENKLTDQAKYNADIAGDYDGITAEDALAVKKILLGIE